LRILNRFKVNIALTFRRYFDLQKAETQARQAQIETAMEKVRARSLAMQKPEELIQVAELLRKEMALLGVEELETSSIYIVDEEKQTAECWYAIKDIREENKKLVSDEMTLNLSETWVAREMLKFYKSKKKKISIVMKGEERKEWINYCASKSKVLEGYYGGEIPERTYHLLKFSNGFMGAASPGEISNESWDLLQRATTVFSFAYTRFLDLQNASARAREAQIQLALERVRARTMAMHKSAELAETAQVLFQQLLELGGIPDRIAIGVVDELAGVVNFWSTDQSGSHINRSFKARLNEEKVMSKTYQAWKDNKKSLVIDLHGDDVREWVRFAREEMGVVVKDDFIKDRRVHNFGFFSHGWILVTTHEPQSAETIQILERFASVFSLTYRRFLDLEKAEAQAREAQIEAALERIRSHSMAMHQSSDLHEVIKVVTEQLLGLGIKFNVANFARILSEGSWDMWISTPEQAYPALVHVPYIDHRIFNNVIEAIAQDRDFFTDAYEQDEKNIFIRHFFENTLAKNTPEERKQYVLSCKGLARSVFLTKNIWLNVSNYDGVPFSNEDNAIFKRFANAFEQSYTRFLDLQKAEANAREAQIEASLERVRSKTMAMHNSNDVGETVATMFAEFVHLGIHTNRCGILIFNNEHTAEVWTARSTPEGNAKLIIGKLDLDAHKMLRSVYNAWHAKASFYQYDLLGDDLILYYTAINNSKFYPTQFDLQALPSKEFHSDFFFTDGAVFSFTGEPVSEEHSKITKRFAGVFGQTYRRYLDLQKAETNAREAQIEAALERVRAKAMAMHKTEDLNPAVAIVFEELDKLDLGMLRCGIGILDKEKRSVDVWSTSTSGHGSTVQVSGDESMDIHPLLQGAFDGWLKQKDFSYTLKGEDLFRYYAAVGATNIRLPQSQTEVATQYYHVTPFKAGSLFAFRETEFSGESKTVMKRFANVFNLTYNRFLDLQKAEAQAREAQIEAGLERVRARTMAMHNSEDVTTTISTVFTELEKLGIENLRCGISIISKDRTMEVWSVSNVGEGKIVKGAGSFDMNAQPIWQHLYEGWEKKEELQESFLAGKEKEDYIKILNANPTYLSQPIRELPDMYREAYYFGEGAVWTYSLQPHSDEHKQVMKRFTSVFSLTFRRYQDLKKAEAQARSAVLCMAIALARTLSNPNSICASLACSSAFCRSRKRLYI